MVYAFSGVSNGIAQGWAARAAMKGTKYDIQTYRVQNLTSCFNHITIRFFLHVINRTCHEQVMKYSKYGTATSYPLFLFEQAPPES